MAPELFTNGTAEEHSDCWSIGAIIYFLLSGKIPFQGKTDKDIQEKIEEGKLDLESGVWAQISDNAKDLIKKLMTVDISERIDIDEAL